MANPNVNAQNDRQPMKESRGGGLKWLLLGLLLLALIIGAMALLGDDDKSSKKKVGTTEDGKSITAADLGSDDADKYFDKDVTVTEEIDDVISDSAFTIGGDSDGLNIPVVGVTDEMFVDSQPVIEKQLRVRVQGRAVEFKQDEFASDYGDQFNDDKYKEFEGKAAIVASSIDVDPADDGGSGEANSGE